MKTIAAVLLTMGCAACARVEQRADAPNQTPDTKRSAPEQPVGGLGELVGKVTYNGKPLSYGSVQFMTPRGAFVAEIKPDGSYRITDLPTGLSKITVTCQDPKYAAFMQALAAASKDDTKPKPKGSPDDFNKIPTKYLSFDTSGLTHEVKPGPQTYNLELE